MHRVAAAVVLTAAILPAQSGFDFVGRYWIPQMSGRIRVDQNGFGTDIDARQDLAIPDTNFAQGSFTWQHRRNRVRFTYTPVDYAGDNTVTRTIVFKGTPYTVGTRIVSELAVQHL